MILAQTNQAQICQIWSTIPVAPGEGFHSREVQVELKRLAHQAFTYQRKHRLAGLEVKGCFGEDGLARQKRR